MMDGCSEHSGCRFGFCLFVLYLFMKGVLVLSSISARIERLLSGALSDERNMT
jgi:hypothetical protein